MEMGTRVRVVIYHATRGDVTSDSDVPGLTDQIGCLGTSLATHGPESVLGIRNDSTLVQMALTS